MSGGTFLVSSLIMYLRDILKLTYEDINKLTYDELKSVTKTASKYANNRLNRLVERYENNPAIQMALDSGGRFGIEDINTLNKMRKELKRTRRFLENPTSTSTGYQKFLKNSAEKFFEKTGIKFTKQKWEKSLKMLNNIISLDSRFQEKEFRYIILEFIDRYYDKISDLSDEEIYDAVIEYYESGGAYDVFSTTEDVSGEDFW